MLQYLYHKSPPAFRKLKVKKNNIATLRHAIPLLCVVRF